MPEPKCSDADFLELIKTMGPSKTALRLQCDLSGVYARRRRLEAKMGKSFKSPDNRSRRVEIDHPQRAKLHVENGTVLVGSDAHYWPGEPSTAHRAFVLMCKRLKPSAVIMNGDVLDASTISKHMPIGWEKRPKLIDEI